MKALNKYTALILCVAMLAGVLCSCGIISVPIDMPVIIQTETANTSAAADGAGNGTEDEEGVGTIPPDTPHTHKYGAWKSNADGHYKECTLCGESAEQGTHISVPDEPVFPTCGEAGLSEGAHCEVCAAVLVAQTPIAATGEHNFGNTELVYPTFESDGYLSGSPCTVCKKVLDGEGTIPAAKNTCGEYAYNALENSGRDFYDALYAECVKFHTNSNTNATEKQYKDNDGEQKTAYVAFSIDCTRYGISTFNEAFDILHSLLADCPIFYWIDNLALSETSSDGKITVFVCTDHEYALGSEREKYNTKIYQALAKTTVPQGGTYEKTLYLHDMIVDTMTYAYKTDGTTPEDAAWAHNIEGYFTRQSGVCETYTEVFAMFLNYWGVENAQVEGEVDGAGHAWNIVNMGDNAWYWFDLTWDDQEKWPLGRFYNYFCVTDSAMSGRKVNTSLYTLPACAETAFETNEVLMVGDIFTSGAYECTVVGYGEIYLNSVKGSGEVTVPETVEYGGMIYTVVGLEKVDTQHAYPVFENTAKTVNLPSTLEYMQSYSLYIDNLTVNFAGTRAQWNAISEGLVLPAGCTVKCSDE